MFEADLYWRVLSVGEKCGVRKKERVLSGERNKARVGYWLKLWKKMLSPPQPRSHLSIFSKRLDKLGIDEKDCAWLFGEVSNSEFEHDCKDDCWCKLLGELVSNWEKVIAEIEQMSSLEKEVKKDFKEGFAFGNIQLGLVAVARKLIQKRLGRKYKKLSSEAWLVLEYDLLMSLTILNSRALATHLHVKRWDKKLKGRTSNQRYRSFERLLSTKEGIVEFLDEYCVLAKLTGTRIRNWVDNNTVMVERFEADLSLLCSKILKQPAEKVVGIKKGASDPHRNQQSVRILTLDTGERVVYKPKNVEFEALFFEFLERLKRVSEVFELKAINILSRNGYGWAEFVEHKKCSSEKEVEKYYWRSGQLLALLYVLGGTDCHSENIIASGDQPVFVDVESVFHAGEISFSIDHNDGDFSAMKKYYDSVFQTGMLPSWRFYEKGKPGYDISALGGSADKTLPIKSPRWINVGTDKISLEFFYPVLKADDNTPKLRGKRVNTADYLDFVMSGFEETYAALQKNKNELTILPVWKEMISAPMRYINHNSQFYLDLIFASFNPDFLRDGSFRDVQLEVMYKSLFTVTEDSLWRVVKSEIDAMRNMDIPLFFHYPDSRDLILETGEVLKDYFEKSGVEIVLERLEALSEKDLKVQLEYIRSSIVTFGYEQQTVRSQKRDLVKIKKGQKNGSEKQILSEVKKLADEICDKTIEGEEGVSWIGLEYFVEEAQVRIQPLSDNFYSGKAGIAVFLAAASRMLGNPEYYSLALRSLAPLRKRINNKDFLFHEDVNVGLLDGIAGVAYGFMLAGKISGDASLTEDGVLLMKSQVTQRLDQTDYFDIGVGASGAALGYLQAFELSGERKLELMAKQSIDKVIELWQKKMHLYLDKKTNKPLLGFSHGSSGVMYAVSEYLAHRDDKKYREFLNEIYEYEMSHFDSKNGGWPDLRNEGEKKYLASWCHGAAGIGLSRLSLINLNPENKKYIDDVCFCIDLLTREDLVDLDHICCGEMGKVEFLLSTGMVLEKPELVNRALEVSHTVILEAKENESYYLYEGLPKGVYGLGLFTGISGIGYELLRVVGPEKIPSILTFKL